MITGGLATAIAYDHWSQLEAAQVKDHKWYMLFNWEGMDSWHSADPKACSHAVLWKAGLVPLSFCSNCLVAVPLFPGANDANEDRLFEGTIHG